MPITHVMVWLLRREIRLLLSRLVMWTESNKNSFQLLAATLSQRSWQHCLSELPCSLSSVQRYVPPCLPQHTAITVIQLKQAAGPGLVENTLYCKNSVGLKPFIASRKGIYTCIC